jgi:hypothetical protein
MPIPRIQSAQCLFVLLVAFTCTAGKEAAHSRLRHASLFLNKPTSCHVVSRRKSLSTRVLVGQSRSLGCIEQIFGCVLVRCTDDVVAPLAHHRFVLKCVCTVEDASIFKETSK